MAPSHAQTTPSGGKIWGEHHLAKGNVISTARFYLQLAFVQLQSSVCGKTVNSWALHNVDQKNDSVTHCVSIEYLFQWLPLSQWIKGARARQLLGVFFRWLFRGL